MEIIYSTINNTCFDNNIASIFIENIEFDESETSAYENYVIQWGGNFSESSFISNDGFIATNLSNGTYTFKVVSTSSDAEGDVYSVTITSPPELSITELKYSEYACENNNGYIYLEISGGTPPYFCSIDSQSTTTETNNIRFNDIVHGEYTVLLSDSAGCSYRWPRTIEIKDSRIAFSVTRTLPPKLLDSYVYLECNVNGYGPFSFIFSNTTTEEKIYVHPLETKYLDNINENNYVYIFNDLLTPGTYDLTVSNDYGCSTQSSIVLPNINEISVNLQIEANNEDNQIYIYREPIPIFNTILVPYKLIVSNSEVWQKIKDKKTKDSINLSIDGQIYEYSIVKNLLNKYCIGDEKIEILRLDNNSDNWFYYFYIAPSINLNNNPEFMNSEIKFVDKDQSFDVTLGLDKHGNLDPENISLVRGSFILNGLEYPEFYNGGNINIIIGDIDLDNTEYYLENIKKITQINTYEIGAVTVINFLEQFNILNENVNVNATYCAISKDEYLYIINIKNILKTINNFNNINNISLYNKENVEYTSLINFNIIGNNAFENPDNTITENIYNIDYFYIDQGSESLFSLYKGQQIIKNVTSVQNIQNGFYIIRIKDLYNNIPRNIRYNSNQISYDDHFLTAKRTIQSYNSQVLDKFLYGDIFVYLGYDPIIIEETKLPSSPLIESEPVVLSTSILDQTFVVVDQTSDTTNTSSISINLSKNIKCYIYGPKNYKKSFSVSTKFANLIPGVYTIIGDQDNLNSLGLYQNETKVTIENNSGEEVFLDFVSYNEKIFIRK